MISVMIEPFEDWGGGRGCYKFVPVLGGDGTKYPLPGIYLTNPLVKGAPICSPWTFRENHSPSIQRVKIPGYTL